MKILFLICILLFNQTAAIAQETGTYFLNKSLNKVIIYSDKTVNTITRNGVSYVYEKQPKVENNDRKKSDCSTTCCKKPEVQ